jgi:hypothetical protein
MQFKYLFPGKATVTIFDLLGGLPPRTEPAIPYLKRICKLTNASSIPPKTGQRLWWVSCSSPAIGVAYSLLMDPLERYRR